MPVFTSPRTWTRETRLLVLTVVISGTVLAVLAQLRFPEQRRSRQRAAPRANRRIAPSATRSSPRSSAGCSRASRPRSSCYGPCTTASPLPAPCRTWRLRTSRGRAIFTPALRLRPDIVIARLAPGLHVEAVVGDAAACQSCSRPTRCAGSCWWFRRQPRRHVAVAGGPDRPDAELRRRGRGHARRRDRAAVVPRTLRPLPGTTMGRAAAGAGRDAGHRRGRVRRRPGRHPAGDDDRSRRPMAVVLTDALTAVADALLSGEPAPLDFGLALQPMNAAVARAVGGTAGSSSPPSPRARRPTGVLRAGDVVTAMAGSRSRRRRPRPGAPGEGGAPGAPCAWRFGAAPDNWKWRRWRTHRPPPHPGRRVPPGPA